VKPGLKAGLGNGKSEQKMMGDRIKASHIFLGADQFSAQTMQNQYFDQKQPDREAAKATENTKKDLRQSHFQFGSFNGPTVTTNQERISNTQNHQLTSAQDKQAVNAGKERLRTVNVHYGKEQPTYISTNKETLVSHDMKQAMVNKQASAEQGKDLRKSHFYFGFQAQFEGSQRV